ncbi:DUF1217 domain-containing protein [Methylocystis echinoides]|uniref:DUF1217 domain-containing protein n=1 Tax=Methylocystis echinoides TaxID=29468 RepID=UPI00344214BD
MTTAGAYLSVSRNLDRWRAIAANKPTVALETKYFKANIGRATSIDALLKDRRLFNYAMKAFGLGDRTNALGMMRKVLEQGVDNSRDLARTLSNANILAFAEAFDYAGGKADVTSGDFVKTITGRYVEQALQAQQGETNPGVERALYFKARAPQLSSVYGVLADKNLLEVVQTTLNIPAASAAQPIDTQARLLKAKLNVEDFKDPKKLEKFIARFAAMYDLNNPGAGTAASANANAILYGASFLDQPVGVDVSLLLRRQNAARGF